MEQETRELFNELLKEMKEGRTESNARFDELSKEIVSIREELHTELSKEIASVKEELHTELSKEIVSVKEEMHTELLKETSSVREEISKVKEETKELFNALVEEMGNMEDRVNKRFEKVDDTLEKMQHEINACKLDRDTVSLLVRKTNELDKRVEILEIKTA